jgi:hypothetical protein
MPLVKEKAVLIRVLFLMKSILSLTEDACAIALLRPSEDRTGIGECCR